MRRSSAAGDCIDFKFLKDAVASFPSRHRLSNQVCVVECETAVGMGD
jgi:hypothetical protein